MAMTPLEQKIEEFAKQALAAQDLVLVSARLMGGARALTLQVLAENEDGTGASIEACKQASRTLAALLDVEELIQSRYYLEVGSPGMDRPLMKPADYKRFVGKQVKLQFSRKLKVADEMLTTLTGLIDAPTDTGFTLLTGHWKNPVEIAFADIRSANLHPSEAEIDAVMSAANLKIKDEKREDRGSTSYTKTRQEGDIAPPPRERKPAFKRGDFLLNERDRKELGVMSDEEKTAAKTERRTQFKKEAYKAPFKAAARQAWGERKQVDAPTGEKKFGDRKPAGSKPAGKFGKKPDGKPSGRPAGKPSGRPAGKPAARKKF
ncbi:MAG: hypothetical protein COY40_06985 [Alphaproteobacteria bacterium CG_4_10_14_0_8_um_filter_53_9]|nr:MAG: hypothetical protein COY40_06985 [Alphaproteobacteria bacterium CG_4_10_14_0_8_um_filter_53_9]